jgi:hypothetical protein
MPHPFDAYPESNPDFSANLIRRLRQGQLNDQMIHLLQQGFETELAKETHVLSRPERVRLFRQAANALLADVLARIEKTSS